MAAAHRATWGLYARVSTEEQASESLSVDAQLSALHAWARQNGHGTREFVDAGKSAWTENLDRRPQFKELIDAARAGEIAGVAVTHLDRFSRKLIVTLSVLGDLGQRGVGFVSLENSAFDFSRPADRLLLAVLGAFAEYYSAELSRKIRRGLAERGAKGLHVGTIPFGFCNGKCPGCTRTCERYGHVPKEAPPVLHPDDWPGVRLAYETYRLGGHSDTSVARALNDSGYRSRTAKGRVLWNKHSIAWLLTNSFYAGLVTVNGKTYPGKHPTIISRELFDEVQAIRRKRLHRTRLYAPKFRVYLLNGLLVCGGCGRKMRAQAWTTKVGGSGKRVYRCTAEESQKVTCPKSRQWVGAEILENQLAQIVSQFRLPQDWRERVSAMLVANGKRQNVDQERRRQVDRLERLKFLFEQGDKTQEDYLRERQQIKVALDALVLPKEREVINAGEYLENLARVWQEATDAERRDLVRAVLEEAVCDLDTARLSALRPKPAFAVLFRQVPGLVERDGIFEV